MTAAPEQGEVLHVISSNARRGAEVFAVELNAALSHVLPGEVVALQSAPAGETLDVPTVHSRWWSMTTWRRIRKHIRGSTAVIAHGSVTLPAVVVSGLGLRTPTIYKSIGDPWFWASNARRRWQTAALLRRVDFVAALTPTAAQSIQDCWKVDPGKIVVTGGGRDTQQFRPPTSAERLKARSTLSLAAERPVVLVLGALSAEKRPDLALEVASRLPGMDFIFAGDGPLRPTVEARARALGGRVRVLGARHDVVRLLHAADVVLLTSASEGLPGVLIEAGLSGLPAVATDVGYVSDIIEHDVTGVISRRGTVTELVEGIDHAMRVRSEMGQRARQRCEELFDARVVRDRWQDLILRASQASLNG